MPRVRLVTLVLALLASASGLVAQVVTPVVSAARNGVAVQMDDATLMGFGRNARGELGFGDTMRRDVPTQVPALGDIVDTALGDFHGLYLRRDGTVLAVGLNDEGQLGDGTTDDRLVPVEVSGLPPIVAVAAGADHSVAVGRDGTVWTWGSNEFGQLGRGTAGSGSQETSPGQVTQLTNAIIASCGGSFTHVITRPAMGPQEVWAFGIDVRGQLGTGSGQSIAVPSRVNTVIDPIQVASGDAHTWFLQRDGRVLATGANDQGQLGLGDTNDRSPAVLVTSLANVQLIGCGGFASFAQDGSNRLWATGSNLFGQLGVGDLSPMTSNRETSPREVMGVPPLAAIDGGSLHTVALTAEGRIVAFGSDGLGQLGLASGIAQQPMPQVLTGVRPGRPAAAIAPATVPFGEPLTWFLGGFPTRPFSLYAFDFTLAGTSPGIFIPGPNISVPLNPPFAFLQTQATIGPQRFSGFVGVLDAGGRGVATFDLPPDPALAGVRIDAALLIFDRTGIPEVVSPPSTTDVTTPRPEIVSLSPRLGATAGGTMVTIRGTSFTPGTTVSFGMNAATSVTVVDARTITCVAPAGMPGFVDVTLTDTQARTSTLTGAFEYRLTDPVPTITAVSPVIGPVSGGLTITITGRDFLPGAVITFGTNQTVAATVPSSTMLTCTLPAGLLGPVTLEVANPSSEPFTLTDGFVYVEDLAITAVTPSAPNAGETVTVDGRGFLPGVTIAIGGQSVIPTMVGLNALDFVMPAGLGCDLTLAVNNPGGFSVNQPLNPTPTVNLVFGSGTVRPGDPVPVFGTGFDERMTATINGAAAAVTFVASTQVVVTAPIAAPGSTASLVLTTGAGCTVTTSIIYGP